MADYEVLSLTEEDCLKLHPLPDEAVVSKDPGRYRRNHVLRWRKDMAFQSFAVEKLEATWGSQLKLSLFLWRVPIDKAARASAEGQAAQVAVILLLLTTHYSLLTTHYSRLTTHYSLLTTHYSLLTTHYSRLTTHS